MEIPMFLKGWGQAAQEVSNDQKRATIALDKATEKRRAQTLVVDGHKYRVRDDGAGRVVTPVGVKP